jgi:formylglycine-generating enzyme required for sulfatase activity
MKKAIQIVCAVVLVVVLGSGAMAKVNIETVPVGYAGNLGEVSGLGAGGSGPTRICGAVDYKYNIGKYEVTNAQYCEFLNAIAESDTYGLYNGLMGSNARGGIMRSGSSGSYMYGAKPNMGNKPVNYVSWGNAARFANWLHNGQPTGTLTGNPVQDAGLTEDGSYDLNGATNNTALQAVSREPDWTWAVPSEDEWYKAAYYRGDAKNPYYSLYPTGAYVVPTEITANVTGDGSAGGTGHYANRNRAADWNGQDGNVTTVGTNGGPNPYGAFDMAGNVWELNETIIGSFRGARGGSFATWDRDMRAKNRFSSEYPTGDSFGFRVVEVPEPATMGLLALGGLAVLSRRSPRRRRLLRRRRR